MSRIGSQPIEIPSAVKISVNNQLITVEGPRGNLQQTPSQLLSYKLDGSQLTINRKDDSKRAKAEHGLMRSLINNMVIGVTDGFEKQLEVVGIGYKIRLEGQKLILNIGFSHEVIFVINDDINATINGNSITISGISKQQVGQVAASIRQLKKPEPYKGKGIKYKDEIIKRKAGKGAKASE